MVGNSDEHTLGLANESKMLNSCNGASGVRSCDSSTIRRCTPILNWSEKAHAEKEGEFQSENNLTWLKMIGE